MREIKFRAWDVINKQMYPVAFPTWNGATSGKRDFVHHTVELIEEDGDDKPILMQFTGLKDKKGVDIYEGDILQGGNNSRGQVKWGNCGFCFENTYRDESLDYLHDVTQGRIEIIGNIYEHPELLEAP